MAIQLKRPNSKSLRPRDMIIYPIHEAIPFDALMMGVEICFRPVFATQLYQQWCCIGPTHQRQPQRLDAMIHVHSVQFGPILQPKERGIELPEPSVLSDHVLSLLG